MRISKTNGPGSHDLLALGKSGHGKCSLVMSPTQNTFLQVGHRALLDCSVVPSTVHRDNRHDLQYTCPQPFSAWSARLGSFFKLDESRTSRSVDECVVRACLGSFVKDLQCVVRADLGSFVSSVVGSFVSPSVRGPRRSGEFCQNQPFRAWSAQVWGVLYGSVRRTDPYKTQHEMLNMKVFR